MSSRNWMCIGKYKDSHLHPDMIFKSGESGNGNNALQFVTLQNLTYTEVTRLDMEAYCCRALLHTSSNAISAGEKQGRYAYYEPCSKHGEFKERELAIQPRRQSEITSVQTV